jgi:hypothetical protein
LTIRVFGHWVWGGFVLDMARKSSMKVSPMTGVAAKAIDISAIKITFFMAHLLRV